MVEEASIKRLRNYSDDWLLKIVIIARLLIEVNLKTANKLAKKC